MPSQREKFAAIAARVVGGELDEQRALEQFIAVSEGTLDRFTGPGVLELHLTISRAAQRLSGLPADDRYAPREQLKRSLADQVASNQMSLQDAAAELGMAVDQAGAVLGAHREEVYGISLRDPLYGLAGDVHSAIKLARAVEEAVTRLSHTTSSSTGRSRFPATGPIGGPPGQQPSGAPSPYPDSPPSAPRRVT